MQLYDNRYMFLRLNKAPDRAFYISIFYFCGIIKENDLSRNSLKTISVAKRKFMMFLCHIIYYVEKKLYRIIVVEYSVDTFSN